jgi:hypothetical protein
MTDAEWLSCTDPSPMLTHLGRGASDRKLRLFACACCRAIWHLLADERTRKLVEVIELEVDGLARTDTSDSVRDQAGTIAESSTWIYMTGAPADRMVTGALLAESALGMASDVAGWVRKAVQDARPEGKRNQDARRKRSHDTEGLHQCELLRDIFANPFRPASIDPSWQTPAVVDLAKSIYDERAFGRMPILGNALDNAGCADAEILAHCHEPGEHVRGCWVVDALLGKV